MQIWCTREHTSVEVERSIGHLSPHLSPFYPHSVAHALDAADGVIDGKYYGKEIRVEVCLCPHLWVHPSNLFHTGYPTQHRLPHLFLLWFLAGDI